MIRIISDYMAKEARCPHCWRMLTYEKEDISRYDLKNFGLDFETIKDPMEEAYKLRKYELIPLERGVIICPECKSHFEVDEVGGIEGVCDLFNEDAPSNFDDFVEKVRKFGAIRNEVLHVNYAKLHGRIR